MKNLVNLSQKIGGIFLFVMMLATFVSAQQENDSRQVLVKLMIVDVKSEPLKFPPALGFGASTRPDAKALLQKGKMVNNISLLAVNGFPVEFNTGAQLPVEVKSLNGSTVLDFINAGLSFKATPQIIEDANKQAVAAKVQLEFSDNEIDASVASDIPSVYRRAFKTSITLKSGETFVLTNFRVKDVDRYYVIKIENVARQ